MADDESRIPTNQRTLLILEALAKAGRPMTVTELNADLGLPKPSIHRLCQMLIAEGFLARDVNSNRLKPARRARTMASGLMSASHTHIARHKILERLSKAIGETCNISVPSQSGMTYIDRVETQWPMRIALPIGSSVPFHCTASGKLFLSTFHNSDLRQLVTSLDLEAKARNTITDPAELIREAGAISKRGYSFDNQEFIDGLIAVAVPIIDPNDHQFAALAFHAPEVRMSLKEAKSQVDVLERAADELSQVLFGGDAL